MHGHFHFLIIAEWAISQILFQWPKQVMCNEVWECLDCSLYCLGPWNDTSDIAKFTVL